MDLTRTDWDALLVAPDVDTRLEDLQQKGVLAAVFPCLQALVGFGGGDTGHKDLWAHTKQVVKQTKPEPILRWAALFHDVGKPQSFSREHGKITFHHHEAVSARLWRQAAMFCDLFTPEELQEVSSIIKKLGYVEGYDRSWTDSAVRRLTKELGPHLYAVLAVARADCTTKNPEKKRQQQNLNHDLKSRIEALLAEDAIPPALPTGLGDLLKVELGLTQGVELGLIMKSLKARVEAGELPRNADPKVYLDAIKTG